MPIVAVHGSKHEVQAETATIVWEIQQAHWVWHLKAGGRRRDAAQVAELVPEAGHNREAPLVLQHRIQGLAQQDSRLEWDVARP